MRILAISCLILGALAWGETVEITPILTVPGAPRYFRWALECLSRAETEVLALLSDCRFYGEGSEVNRLLEALAAARGRGATVRVLIDRREDTAPETGAAFSYLRENGIEVRWDDPETTMHAKLLVIDGETVVLGSSPWTYNGLFRSVQVDLSIRSPAVGDAFRRFFQVVWEGRCGREAVRGDVGPPALVPLTECPEGELLHLTWAERILSGAEAEVDLALYMLRRYPWESPVNRLVEALAAAAARGVRVRVLLEGGEGWMDPGFARGAREVATYLLLHGVEVRFDPPDSTLHAKFLAVDGADFLISSANWAYYSLVRNVEAGVALLDTPELGEPFARFFRALWSRSRRLP